jgi:hypothetical protein
LSWKTISLAILSYSLIALALFLNGAGMWASISSLLEIFNDPDGGVGGPFSCADNSLF